LSATVETAFKVGNRHGRPVVIPFRARDMYRTGIQFYFTANEVWLVDSVPPQYLYFERLLYS
jgi:putative RNA 2'-phosphotransferase